MKVVVIVLFKGSFLQNYSLEGCIKIKKNDIVCYFSLLDYQLDNNLFDLVFYSWRLRRKICCKSMLYRLL